MKKTTFLILTALSLSLGLSSARTWTQASTGKQLEGELTRINGEKILITRSNGSSLEIPIAMLNEEDQQYIAEWQKEKMSTGAPAAPGETSEESVAMEIPEGPTELVLSDVHLCCGGCKKAVEGALGTLTGVEISAGRSDVTIKGESGELVKTALEYVMDKGFYGTPSIAAFAPTKKYSTDKKESVSISKVHLCCDDCVEAAEDALMDVEGAEEIEGLEAKARDFVVKGMISPADVVAALNAVGLHGSVR